MIRASSLFPDADHPKKKLMNINDFIQLANQLPVNDLMDLASQVTEKLDVNVIDAVQELPFKSWYSWQVD